MRSATALRCSSLIVRFRLPTALAAFFLPRPAAGGTFPSIDSMPVTTPYYREKHARRAKRRPGLYPALVVLGIYDRCTPKLASDASRAVAMLSSLAEAQAQLRSDGIALERPSARPPIATLRGPERPSRARRAVCWTA